MLNPKQQAWSSTPWDSLMTLVIMLVMERSWLPRLICLHELRL
ncbi:hypothetical protein M8C21_000221 [Ambrosia artemisiifolia]|uniref:Uncharacterized protein n=1 Tax=Ambrosia artemisiifolia TaxID=4212 RepID=A0AAD5CBA3_AMBAR|nr:hypothetical protein M8C21_000221 [Ambrosia artemisiifolia]